MKCPKCKTENENRSVCKNCGLFLYRPDRRNAPKLSDKELRQRDWRTVWRVTRKILKYVGIIITAFVLSFWFFYLAWFFFFQ
ncbi:MAG: hypothetical protein GXY43_05480 [Clostridiaceae bacterium]|nr:hypothetical protein [Clostridiaceae bacterium]